MEKKSWKSKIHVEAVQKYMSSEEVDELRRTSRTVCHRLVTPLPTPSVKERRVSWGQSRKRRGEICR